MNEATMTGNDRTEMLNEKLAAQYEEWLANCAEMLIPAIPATPRSILEGK